MSLKSIILASMAAMAFTAAAQDQSSSSAVMTRGSRTRPGQQAEQQTPGVSARQQQRAGADNSTPDSSLKYLRVIYRELDLVNEDANAPLYFPEDLIDGQENLFRIMFRLFAQNKVPAYQYLDGREDFSEGNRESMKNIIDRHSLTATEAKGFSEKNPVYDFNPVDVPTGEVLAYYIIERWEFDDRTNRMNTTVEAICPVMVHDDDSSYEIKGKIPLFWMKMSDLRPYLQAQYIFTDDDNNLAAHTYDDFFTLNMYKGDIYKTRNLRNQTLAQMTDGDPDDLKRAQDSIQNRLDHYADNLWVPTREELARRREIADSIAAAADTTLLADEQTTPARSARAKRSAKTSTRSREAKRDRTRAPKKEKVQKPKSSSSATRSIRNRRKN